MNVICCITPWQIICCLVLLNVQLHMCVIQYQEQSKVLYFKDQFIETVTPCDTEILLSQIVVDCSGRSLTDVHRSWFPDSTSEIMLHKNLLTVIRNGTLNNLYQLKRLSLQDNLLSHIQPEAFHGLNSLLDLNLDNNYLDLFRIPVDTFTDLNSLTELHLLQFEDLFSSNKQKFAVVRNLNNGSFPDQMFGHLLNLTTLSITVDDASLHFNEEFNHLLNLKDLTISGKLNNISEDSFQSVKFVQNLRLYLCTGLNSFSEYALKAFLNLKNIVYEKSELSLQNAFKTLRPLVGTHVSYLRFERLRIANQIYSSFTTRDGFLNETSTQFLKQICLRELHLIENGIFVIFRGTFTSPTFDRCLKKLSIFEKHLLGTSWALAEVLRLDSLQDLAIVGSSACDDRFEKSQRFLRYISHSLSGSEATELFWRNVDALTNMSTHNFNLLDALYLSNMSAISNGEFNKSHVGIIIFISPSLQTIHMASLFGVINLDVKVQVQGAQNVFTLRMIDNGIKMVKIPIEGLSSVKEMHFSYNNFSTLSTYFLSAYLTLEILFLDNCRLSNSFMSQHSHQIFQNLSQLRHLDLSYNSLDVFSRQTFSNNPQLTNLNIASNRFRTIPFDLKLTPNLNYLDLRQNVLTTISKLDRDVLESNKERLGSLQILLSGNIFSCGCDNIEFLQWIRLTTIQLDDNRNFTCIDSDGVLTFTLVHGDLEGLWRACWSQVFFNLSIVLMCFLFIGFLVTFLWMKNKTLITSIVLQLFMNFKLKLPSDYQCGVFIGYADSDYQFACSVLRNFIENDLNLTTFIRDRDLLPSISIAEGLMEAMNSSWRILLVVNERFIHQNDWFLFTVRSAVYSISPANPSRVVIVVDENCINQLPEELFNAVPEDNIITISKWQMSYKLKEALRTRLA